MKTPNIVLEQTGFTSISKSCCLGRATSATEDCNSCNMAILEEDREKCWEVDMVGTRLLPFPFSFYVSGAFLCFHAQLLVRRRPPLT
jgi:hypothetical protein